MLNQIQTEQLGLGRILSLGWKLYSSNLKNIVPIFLVVYLPINVVLNLLPIEEMSFSQMVRIVQITEALIGIIATLALAYLIEERLHGRPVGFKEALKHGLKRWGHGVGTGIVGGVIIIGLLLLLIVPGIIWMVYYSFMVYVVSLRGKNGKEALDYSKMLVKGQWWRVFGIFLVITLLMLLSLVALGLPAAFLPEGIWTFPLNLASDTLVDLVYALFLVMEIVFFLNVDYLKNSPLVPAASSTVLPVAS